MLWEMPAVEEESRLRVKAMRAYREITGKRRTPGLRELRNIVASGQIYSRRNEWNQTVEKMMQVNGVQEEHILLVRRMYEKERMLTEDIIRYLTFSMSSIQPVRLPMMRRLRDEAEEDLILYKRPEAGDPPRDNR